MRIGFYGLGNMGAAMATNLVRAGHEVIVYNRTIARAEPLARLGAKVAARPEDMADAEVVVTMLADDAAVESAVFEGQRPGPLFGRGAVHLSASTISVALARRLAEAHARAGGAMVSGPVFGRPDAAASGKLFVVAAGRQEVISRCEPIFAAIAQKTYYIGEDPSAANVVKLTGNFLLAATIQAMAEAFALAARSGLARERVFEVLTSTLFTAPVHKGYGGKIARGEYGAEEGFALTLGLKDVRLVLEAAEAAGCPMPTASLVHDQLLTGKARGLGAFDWSVLGRLAAENAGEHP